MSSRKPPSQRDPSSNQSRVTRALTSMVPGSMHGRVANSGLITVTQASGSFAGGASDASSTEPNNDGTLTRGLATYTTASLVAGDHETGNIKISSDFRILYIETDAPARVRLYNSTSDQLRDIGRPITYDPFPGLGIIMDFLTAADLLAAPMSPIAEGALFTTDSSGDVSDSVPITVTSIDGGTVSVQLTFTAFVYATAVTDDS